MKLPGLNVQAPWARLLLDGSKTIETRTYPLPLKHVGHDMWLIETPGRIGKFKARVIGTIRFSSFKQYKSSREFNSDIDLHLVRPTDPDFAWSAEIPKFGWIVETVKIISPFEAPSSRGHVYSRAFENSRGV